MLQFPSRRVDLQKLLGKQFVFMSLRLLLLLQFPASIAAWLFRITLLCLRTRSKTFLIFARRQ
ncbi:MAG: hypothetical protein ACPIOQ_73475, partial [Promethearchaeia archaeon]